MHWWKRSSPEEEQLRVQAQQEAETSQLSLLAGGLPTQAKRRLSQETAAGHLLFSSDLSTREFVLTRRAGYRTLRQVMGSSIYHVGWQYTWNYPSYTTAYELMTVTNAHQHAAQLALDRLEQEAMLLKAHGVIGVRLNTRDYEWGRDLLEYTAFGTAVRLPDAPLFPRPFLSDLSGQEFWTLLQVGYFPAGLVTGYCSYCVSTGREVDQIMCAGSNQEIGPYTQAVYTARNLVMNRLAAMARSFDAVGVVGIHIGFSKKEKKYERNQDLTTYRDLFIDFSAVGSAIVSLRPDHVIPSPKPTLDLTDLHSGRSGETRELTIKK
jgi:uncharacterized protein YbjQ (UPF0145 family)